jgi:peptidoglycan/LPS O-acetylase OafA/YrhL
MPRNYLPTLTPLRGIAAMMVLVYHYQVMVMPLINPNKSILINKWYIMVDFFFVLSGFIIMHVYQKYFQEGFQWTAFKTFMTARFARLYPLHLFTLLMTIGVFACLKGFDVFEQSNDFIQIMLRPDAIPANLFLLQASGIFSEPTWNSPSWSIAVEWWTYMLFPLFVLFFNKNKPWGKWLAGALVLLGYLSIIFYFQPKQFIHRQTYLPLTDTSHTIDVMVGSSIIRCICGFVLGMIVYQAFKKKWGAQILSSSYLMSLTGLGLLVGWYYNILPDVVTVMIFALAILMSVYNNGTMKKVLNTKLLTFVGDVSYSIYMVHIPIILAYHTFRVIIKSYQPISDTPRTSLSEAAFHSSTLFTTGTAWLGLLIFITIVLTTAYFTFNYVEHPMRRYINQYLKNEKNRK